jgi:hypothetical protein
MLSVPVSAIQERVRVLCDLPVYTTDTPITVDVILDFVKVATELLAAIVGEASAELYFASAAQLTTAPGVPTVALPAAFTSLIRVSWLKSVSEDIGLEVASSDHFEAYPSAWLNVVPRYRLSGQSLQLFPTPDAAYTLNAFFSTGLSPTTAADVLVLRAGWDLWIGLQTAILVRARQQKDASDFSMLLGKVENDLRRQLKRDRWGIRRVRDMRRGGDGAAPRNGRWW